MGHLPTLPDYCLWPVVLIPGGLLPAINKRQSGRGAWAAWHQRIASHPVLHVERSFRHSSTGRVHYTTTGLKFHFLLFAQELLEPVGQHTMCYFLLVNGGDVC